jgi:hypothetical protein
MIKIKTYLLKIVLAFLFVANVMLTLLVVCGIAQGLSRIFKLECETDRA